MVADGRNFLLNTDYPLDKAIYLESGSATVNSPTAGQVITVAHGLLFTPLVSGSWALVSDFSTSYEYGSGVFPSSNIGASIFDRSMSISADATNVYIRPVNVSGSSFTVYYRIYGLEPDDVNLDVSPTASAGDTFTFNTDYRYMKLYLKGSYVPSGSGGSTSSVVHNLGYRPQVGVWFENGGVTAPLDVSSLNLPLFNPYVSAVVTTTNLDFTIPSGTYPKVHYRIYLEGDV